MKELLEMGTFQLAIVAEEEYLESPDCPHCRSDKDAITVDKDMDLGNHIADLLLCPDCGGPFILASYPTLFETSHPVFLDITLKKDQPPLGEVTPSAVALQILAAANIPEPTEE